MKQSRTSARVHGIWLVVCVAAVVFSGVALSTKNGEPLTRGTFVKVADQTLPAVVSITISQAFDPEQRGGGRLREMWEYFEFHMPQLEEDGEGRRWMPVSGGSGVIIRPDGYIVTNYHVVGPATESKDLRLTIKLHEKDREFTSNDVEIVATDSLRDLAVLKVDAKNLPYLKWGDSKELAIGEWVLAVGNPLDLEGTASQGIVSQKHRKIQKSAVEDLLQTTAMINPGNSGGALVNLDGKLVGINVAIASNTGRWQGVGFAIPSEQAEWVTDSIIEHGRVIQGYLGVKMHPETSERMSKQNQRYFDLPTRSGVLIESVPPSGPAEEAGLRQHDVIRSLRVNGEEEEIEKNSDLLSAIAKRKVGTKVEVVYYRDGKERTTTLTIAERPQDDELADAPESREELEGQIKQLGVTLEPASGQAKGLRITKVVEDGPASKAEPVALAEGDVITEIDYEPLETADDVRKILSKGGKGGLHRITFVRGGNEATTFVDM